MSYRRIVGCLALISLWGCETPGPIGEDPAVEVADLSSLPSPNLGPDGSLPGYLTIGSLDRLSIAVYGVPDLSTEVQIDDSGYFRFPLIGEVRASGRQPSEVARAIETALRGRYVRDPYVTVNITERPAQMITIGGEITNPGRYPVIGETSLMEAVALGGGMSEFSRLDDVLVFREVGTQRYIGVYNFEAIQRGNYPDPAVYPDDIIMVGDSPNRRLIRDIIQIAPLVTTPLILLERTLD